MTRFYSQAELPAQATILRRHSAMFPGHRNAPRAKLGAAILAAVLLTLAGSQLAASMLSRPAPFAQTAQG